MNEAIFWINNKLIEGQIGLDILKETRLGKVGFNILQVADLGQNTVETITNITKTVKLIGLGLAVLCFTLAGIGFMFGGQLQQKSKGLFIGTVVGIIILVSAQAIQTFVESQATE